MKKTVKKTVKRVKQTKAEKEAIDRKNNQLFLDRLDKMQVINNVTYDHITD